MALDPTISLQAGKIPNEQQGLISQNLLSDPSKLNALLQMQGNVSAGKALQAAIDPQTGAFSQEAFAKALAATGGVGAIDALNKGLTAGRAQLEQSIIKRTQLQKNLASLLIDPRMKSDPKYANDMFDSKVKELAQQGVITPQLASAAASGKPVDAQGNLDLNALNMQLNQQLFSTLSPQEQVNAKYGNQGVLNTGDSLFPYTFNPFESDKPDKGFNFGQPIQQGLTPEAAIFPQAGPTIGGAPSTVPGANRANQFGIPNPTVPRQAPTTAPKPQATTPPNGYMPMVARRLESLGGDKKRIGDFIEGLSASDKKVLGEWLDAQSKAANK